MPVLQCKFEFVLLILKFFELELVNIEHTPKKKNLSNSLFYYYKFPVMVVPQKCMRWQKKKCKHLDFFFTFYQEIQALWMHGLKMQIRNAPGPTHPLPSLVK